MFTNIVDQTSYNSIEMIKGLARKSRKKVAIKKEAKWLLPKLDEINNLTNYGI